MGKKYREQWRIKNFWGNRNSVAQTIHTVRHFMLYFSKYMDKHAGELSWIFKRLINIPGLNTWGGFKYPLSSLFQLYHLRRQFNTNTWSLTAQEHTELIQLHQHHMPLCVCVCLCSALCNLITHVDECNHHHNQDTELCHQHQATSCYSFITMPSLLKPWQPLICSPQC